MKRISGTTLALIGLFFGLSAGLGVVMLKYYIVQEIVDALDEEVKNACDCKLEFDSFSLSFFGRNGRATNVRIVENGVPRLWFDEVTTDVNIDQIREKKVYLENLVLSNGTADGVGPDSVTFRFIDQLTTPLPPEKQKADRWRAILNTLEMRNSRIRESFGSSELLGSGTSLFVQRVEQGFSLRPHIADLRYRSFSKNDPTQITELRLGELSTSIIIEDARTLFDPLRLGRDSSNISLQMAVDTDHGDRSTGSAKYELTPGYIGLPDWLQGAFVGQAGISGTLGSPIISGNISNAPATQFSLLFPHASPLTLDSIKGSLVVDVNHGDPIITLKELAGLSKDSFFQASAPLVFSDKGLVAGFDLSVPSFSYGPLSLTDATAHLEVTPEGEDSLTQFSVKTKDLALQGTSLGPASLKIALHPTKVDINVESTDPKQGRLTWQGSIDIAAPEPVITKGELKLVRFRYPNGKPVESAPLSPIEITSDLSFKGPVDLSKLTINGETTISFPATPHGMALNGKTTLKDGILTVALPNSAYKGSATLKVDLVGGTGGKLAVNLPGVALSHIIDGADCGAVNAALDYSFPLTQPLGGRGSLNIAELKIGCAPYVLELPKDSLLPIVGGSLAFKDISLSGSTSALNIAGTLGFVNGFDLAVNGDLYLSALLPLLPSIDNLQGLVKTKLTAKGPINQPSFAGIAELSKGEFGLQSPDLEAHNVSGIFNLEGDRVRLQDLGGVVNTGTFELGGTLLLAEFERSTLTAHMQEVTIEPINDTSITFSGDLALGSGKDKRQILSGDIAIDFAEIKKDFNMNQILMNAISGYFLPRRIQPQVGKKPVDIDLDVQIHAPRNIFVITPFFSAELNTQIHASQSVSEPALTGSMQILSGWVGLKGNRFEITSGSLAFRPGALTPTISIASEGSLRTPSGDNILVILEANGPLTAPRIVLSSDRGLSQSDLLLLITSSRSLTGRTMANRLGDQFGDDQRFFLSTSSFSSIGAFFSNLSKIDVLSFEPAYNPFTGSIEPAVVAKKKIAPRFALVGESLLGTVSSSRAGAVYNLTPTLNVSSFLQTVSTQKNTIFSADLTHTILSEQSTFITFTVEGLNEFNEESILAAARLGAGSRVRNDAASLTSIQRDIVQYMHNQGFRNATANITCTESDTYCHQLLLLVDEGAQFTIASISTDGDALSPEITKRIHSVAKQGDAATSLVANRLEGDLVLALRNEGYIAARISPSYRNLPDTTTAELTISADIREPISFVFKGNSLFSANDFLDSIDLFSRKRPFGNNTIKLLVQNIEHMYQERGYLFVQVTYKEDRSNPARLSYEITIAEESPTKVGRLTIQGNEHLSLDRIEQVMEELGFAEQRNLLKPEYAIPDQLDALRDVLITVFKQEGFTTAQASYQIEPIRGGNSLAIIYTVSEGDSQVIEHITTLGFPPLIQQPITPTTPASFPRINRYIEQIVDTLKNEGFPFPSVVSDTPANNNSIELTVEPGQRSYISSISYEGLTRISIETATSYTSFKIGDPYNFETINQTKRDLLRSSLFSRVEIVATDGTIDSQGESITIRLVERPLQTLEIGTGANSEFGLHLFGEAVDKSLFADGRSLSLRVDTYLDQADINSSGSDNISQGFTSLRYLVPSLADSDYSLTEEARYQRQDLTTQAFDLDRMLFGSYLFRQFSSGISMSAGHSLALDHLFNVEPGAIIGPLDDGFVRLSFLSSVIKFDHRDNPLLPNSGYTMTLEPKLSLEAIGSEANFATILAKTTRIVPLTPLGPRFSLGLGASAGISQPFGDTTEIPITQRFYLGGRTTVRGFRENSLGPLGSDGAVIGGDTLLAAKTQFQYLLFDSFSTHLFMDLGNVFLRHESFELSDIREGVGGGFQYLSPIGPIGFDVGHPIDRQEGEPSVRVHFSVGSVF